jgi:hypothetical protein
MHPHPKTGAPLAIAEVFRRFAPPFRQGHPLSREAARVLDDLERCRTAALGVHPYRCDDCGRDVPLFNSCLNRHCPTCQGPAQHRWIEARQQRLLNTPHFHCVFTLPAILRPVVLGHRRELLGLLFRAVSQTLLTFAADPKWLGAQIGFSLVLHTWTREMLFHPHLHAIVAGGGLSADGSQWIRPPDDDFLFPVAAVSRVFRGRFLEGLIDLCNAGQVDLAESDCRKLVRTAKRSDWVVYTKRAFGGPEHVVRYLGRYTHRVAISSARLVSITDHRITLRTRGDKSCALAPDEFLRRFLLHILPDHFVKIRHYGLLAPANVKTRLARAQELLGTYIPADDSTHAPNDSASLAIAPPAIDLSTEASAKGDADTAAPSPTQPRCPHCGGRLTSLPGFRPMPRPPPTPRTP